ncbi:MAG: hypothetical protein GY719_37810 [bacterium]|nr:hypothetical protein [bacterium]
MTRESPMGEAGVRRLRELQEDRDRVTARQTAWPEDSPLSEAELREVLETARSTLVATHRHMEDLFACLPMPADYDENRELSYDYPRTIYFGLHTAVFYLMELFDAETHDGFIRRVLEATPESLWKEWAELRPRLGSRTTGYG